MKKQTAKRVVQPKIRIDDLRALLDHVKPHASPPVSRAYETLLSFSNFSAPNAALFLDVGQRGPARGGSP